MSALRFHELTVKRVSPEAAGSVAITFDIPPAELERFHFEPGQFLTVKAVVDGRYFVEIEGNGIAVDDLRTFAKAFDFAKLTAMK